MFYSEYSMYRILVCLFMVLFISNLLWCLVSSGTLVYHPDWWTQAPTTRITHAPCAAAAAQKQYYYCKDSNCKN